MKREAMNDLYDRTLRALRGERPEGSAEPGTVPVAHYLDAARLEREIAVARRSPQPIASSSELPAPGSWVSRDRAGVPILLVRQADGQVKGFLNVCRHRGARVVPEGAGEKAHAFSCPYHAWSYRPDGALLAVPHAFGFPCLDKSSSGLRELAVRERVGLIWVVADPELAKTDIDLGLGPLADELEALDLRTGFAARSYEIAANWKILVDGFFEAYHFKVAHRETIAKMFTENTQLVDEHGKNRRIYLVKSNFDPAAPPPREDFDPRRYGNILYYFFPFTTILVQPDHAQVSVLDPRGVGATMIHEVTLIPRAPDSEKAVRHWQANVDLYRRTLLEDYSIAETIQSGLRSGANTHLNFGTFEFSIPRFHAQLERELEP